MTSLERSIFPVLNALGAIIVIFGSTMLLPLAFAYFGDDAALPCYDSAILITLAAGALLLVATHRYRSELMPRDGFLLVTLVWTALPAFGTLPFLLFFPHMSFTDAYFEAMSGFTATGATVIEHLDALPLSINVWRHLLEWIGGMGILVLAVAILPLLGVGGSQVFKAEATGPLKEHKLTPRIAETAKGLYAIYFGLSALCLLALRWAGMDWADAFMMMCTTMSLGGFAPYDASVGHWDSQRIETVLVVFMLVAGLNFSMHFRAWRQRSVLPYLRDPETKTFFLVVLAAPLLVTGFLLLHGVYPDLATAWRHALFNTVSMATTAGLTTADYNLWPVFAPILFLLLASFVPCAGSTGGGIKMIRTLILAKQALREFTRILHPRVINPVRLGGQVIENNVIFSVLAFMLIYGSAIIFCTLLLLFSGLDFISAFSAVAACISNAGPGLNLVGPATTYAALTDVQTWICVFAMLIGRLEMMSVLVLLTPAFWRN